MRLRLQPPALSPVSLRALIAGGAAAIGVSRPRLALSQAIAERLIARQVFLMDSGTSALQIALRMAARRRPGAVVGLPAWGCYDIISAALGSGVPIAWYDIDPATLQPRPESLAKLAELRPGGVVIVHAYGVPVDLAAVKQSVGDEALIIEDAAQGWGGSLNGKPLGGAGDLSIFSFGRGKGITGGSGGALALLSTRTEHLAPELEINGRVRAGWRDLEVAAALWVLGRPQLYSVPASMPWLRLGETVYKPPHPVGPMSRAALAMVARSLSAADAEAAHRRTVAVRLSRAVASSQLADNVVLCGGAVPGWLRLPVLVRNAELVPWLLHSGRAHGIALAYPRDLPAVARESGSEAPVAGSIAGAKALSTRLVTLPTHSMLSERDLAALEQILKHLERR